MASILIVDDDPIVAQIASDLLCDAGHICGHVPSAAEAMRVLSFRRPDCILLDQHMPDTSGGQFLRQLRQSPEFYDLPVIMFTGMTGQADEEQARYNGAQEYIRKPFKPDQLLSTVTRLLVKYAARPQHRSLREVMAERVDADRTERRALRM